MVRVSPTLTFVRRMQFAYSHRLLPVSYPVEAARSPLCNSTFLSGHILSTTPRASSRCSSVYSGNERVTFILVLFAVSRNDGYRWRSRKRRWVFRGGWFLRQCTGATFCFLVFLVDILEVWNRGESARTVRISKGSEDEWSDAVVYFRNRQIEFLHMYFLIQPLNLPFDRPTHMFGLMRFTATFKCSCHINTH